MSVTKVVLSKSTEQAIVHLEGDQAACLLLRQGVEEGVKGLLEDIESGKFELFLLINGGGDTAEEIASTEAEADDWTTIYEAQA